MKAQRNLELLIYRAGDFIAAVIAWIIFFYLRKETENPGITFQEVSIDPKLKQGLILIPLMWMILYSIFDTYRDIYRFSRLETLKSTIFTTFIGVLLLFFTVLMDDTALRYTSYFSLFISLFLASLFACLIFQHIPSICSRPLDLFSIFPFVTYVPVV